MEKRIIQIDGIMTLFKKVNINGHELYLEEQFKKCKKRTYVHTIYANQRERQ